MRPAEASQEARRLVSAHGADRVGLLLEVQERHGYLPPALLEGLARVTRSPLVEWEGLASFYRCFRLEPRGRHLLGVCTGTACHVAGGQRILESLAEKAGAPVGGTSSDGAFTVEARACLGCCSLAPVVEVDEDVRARVRAPEALGWLEQLREAP